MCFFENAYKDIQYYVICITLKIHIFSSLRNYNFFGMNRRIYVHDWLLLKPYKSPSKSDFFYLQLANRVKDAVVDNKNSLILFMNINEDDVNLFACILTSYFEDLISHTNIWNAFVETHRKMYGRLLPFYDLGDDYCRQEINVEDICFLIWDFISSVNVDKIINPNEEYIREIAQDVYGIFDEVWEIAPENHALQLFYYVDENGRDLFDVRKTVDCLMFESYFFLYDMAYRLKKNEERLYEKAHLWREDQLLVLLHDERDALLFNKKTRLLGLSGWQWLAQIVGEEHPLYTALNEISNKEIGLFFYKGQDADFIFAEHIASGKLFDISKKSFDYSSELKKINTIVYLGIVLWDGHWWFSGVFTKMEYDEALIESERKSFESKASVAFLDADNKRVKDSVALKYLYFLEFTHNNPVEFVPASEVSAFINKWIQYYNARMNSSRKAVKWQSIPDNSNESALIYFNPKKGIETVFSVNSAISLPNNPKFKEKESETDFKAVVTSSQISPEFVLFCIANGKDAIPYLKTDEGLAIVDNIDFVLRFFKKEKYFITPLVSFEKE